MGWGELLARDRRGHTPLSAPTLWRTAEDGINPESSLTLSLVEPQSSALSTQFLAADYLYTNIRRVHPLGKEAKFSMSLRGEGSGLTSNYRVKRRAKPQQKAWDASFAAMPCRLFDPFASATALQQNAYKDVRKSRLSFTCVPAKGITKGWEKPPKSSERLIRDVDENARRSRERSLSTPSYSLTGGSFAMSCQLSVSCRLPEPKTKQLTTHELRQMHSEIFGSDGEGEDFDGEQDGGMDQMMGDALKQVFSPEQRKDAGKQQTADDVADEPRSADNTELPAEAEEDAATRAEDDAEEVERGRTRARKAR